MSRLLKFHHSYLDYIIDLGNIKNIEIGTLVPFVRIKFLHTEYLINPKNNKLDIIEPEINFDFDSKHKAKEFVELISNAWESYLEKKE